MKNKTKIIATIGPSSYTEEIIKQMILEGVNVCRINFSHGSHEDYLKVFKTVRKINDELHAHTAILADLQGPKLRIGEIANNKTLIKSGGEIIITTNDCIGTSEKICVNYKEFPKDVKPGAAILIDDGKIVLKAIYTNEKDEVRAEIVQGGVLSGKKGINLPNTMISLPCLTQKDKKDLTFALKNHVEWIGLSFVRSASDIVELKHLIASHGETAKVIAKIEKPQALDDIEYIIDETDGLMIARGDLGVEVPLQDVPLIQKELVKKCQRAAKPVIIATQMMESMIENLSPTRAEVSDVANAVTDGADAVMLSAETSIGKHPVEVIKTIYKIVTKAETYKGIYNSDHIPDFGDHGRLISDSICFNACKLAQSVKAKAIITMSQSGYTGIKVSSNRPESDIFVFSGNKKILNTLNLVWGVKAFYYDRFVSTDHTIADIKLILKKLKMVKAGDLVINITSMPIADKGKTNMLKLSYIDH